ncbi:type IV toxin-antitoxin system AbiEi family antitoxin domain-containing protein [Ornithinimicrobium sp. W1679]|uniref:type IV toxin-antitoxin system AbiEi family antitoxin domain-containing protein n=1 Tax=Ornithinimicrobium sp. W1679 TaxID=3418770 RepID=UPI003CE98C79
MDLPALARRQHGVVSRRQALAAGMSAKQVRWRLHRGAWQAIHPGVYLTNTGTVTWHAQAWAGLLRCGSGAALAMQSASFVWRLEKIEPRGLTIAVPNGTRCRGLTGVTVVQRRRLETRSVEGFPTTSLAQTVIDLAERPDSSLDDAVALAARACQQRSLTQSALLEELAARRGHRWSRELRLAFGEIGDGAESLPEVWYATRVQQPHGLPVFERQVSEDDGCTRTDLKNRRHGVNVEIDGLLWHAGEQFHGDRRRDRQAAARGEVTLRISYLELDQKPCELAVDVARTLAVRGWTGTITPCSSECAALALAAS